MMSLYKETTNTEAAWKDSWKDLNQSSGRFERMESTFRHWITLDGSAGITGKKGFKAESGRYHLYASYACPWAHRTLLLRHMKGLEPHIGVSFVHYFRDEAGWNFKPDEAGIVADNLFNEDYAYTLYKKADPHYDSRITVPFLWDKKQNTIVNNESADIIRMLNSAFNECGANQADFYPEHLREEIDTFNDRIYHTVNNGVYKAGFATTQTAYEEAVFPLFKSLDWLEGILSQQRYLTGDTLTEADLRLFPTLYRFDSAYVGHFKCNLKRLTDYPNLWAYTRELYQLPGVAGTTNMEHVKKHYYQTHTAINPTGVVPAGPEINWKEPHGRS